MPSTVVVVLPVNLRSELFAIHTSRLLKGYVGSFGAVHVKAPLPLKSMPPSARYTKVWFSVMLALPLLLNPPWRRYSVVGALWLLGQASAGAPTLQLVRRAPLPVRVKGPSATMLPPLKVSLALVLT